MTRTFPRKHLYQEECQSYLYQEERAREDKQNEKNEQKRTLSQSTECHY